MAEAEDNELKRINTLKSYKILDTLTEKDYEDITFIASVICNVPIALISFVDEKRQWFKSHLGLSVSETPREHSFCAHALHTTDDMLVVPDSRIDDRFKNNPLVKGDPNIVFYAGVPLVSKDGFGLGTVCVIDRETRTLSSEQIKALKVLTRQVMQLLELRKLNAELELLRSQQESRNKELEQFAMVVSHDIKSPLSNVLLANSMLKSDYEKNLGDKGLQLIAISDNSAKKVVSLVDGILSYHKQNNQIVAYEYIDLSEFFDVFKHTITSPKTYTLTLHLATEGIDFNRTQLEQIFFNLISNSIRYNNKDIVEIRITLEENEDEYLFSLADNGIGIAEENHTKIFDLFTTVSMVDSFGLKNYGVGLPTIKKIIESAGGKIWVNSQLGQGTEFLFTLKKFLVS